MFAAGKTRQPEASVDADADDWLQVGTSFRHQEATRARDSGDEQSALALQLYRGKRDPSKKSKKRKKESEKRKSHKRRRDCGSASSSAEDSDDISDRKQLVRHHPKKHHKKSKHKHRSSRRKYSDDDDRSDSNDSSDASDRDRERHRHHRREHKPKRLREGADSNSRAVVMASAPKEVQVWMAAAKQTDNLDANGSKLFEFDCAGDKENGFYGTLYAQERPLYVLATRRNILTGKWIVDGKRLSVNGGVSKDVDGSRYFGASARKMEKSARQTRLYLAYSEKRLARQREASNKATPPSELAFIPLDPVIDDNRAADVVGSIADDAQNDPQLSLLRTETANVEHYLVARNKLFNESIQKKPHEIATWLDFVAFQEHSLRLNRRNSAAAMAMVLEKQVAILDKALQANPGCRELQRVKLNLTIRSVHNSNTFKADFDAIRQQLEDMIEKDPTNRDLWDKLLRVRQQNFASFSLPSLREVYARIIAILRKEFQKQELVIQSVVISNL
uniref:Uncharacterized protein n=1 Tax=Globisporangium ultimum (strain ATCC 200006 / CBS 805.95 / DAOM BR144) TaxID=431595 RepID=K3WGA5_GLOUD